MRFNIEVDLQFDGFCELRCQEMGLTACGNSIEEAIDKMKNLLVYYTSTIQDAGIETSEREEAVQQLQNLFKGKNFIMPNRPKVN